MNLHSFTSQFLYFLEPLTVFWEIRPYIHTAGQFPNKYSQIRTGRQVCKCHWLNTTSPPRWPYETEVPLVADLLPQYQLSDGPVRYQFSEDCEILTPPIADFMAKYTSTETDLGERDKRHALLTYWMRSLLLERPLQELGICDVLTCIGWWLGKFFLKLLTSPLKPSITNLLSLL